MGITSWLVDPVHYGLKPQTIKTSFTQTTLPWIPDTCGFLLAYLLPYSPADITCAVSIYVGRVS